MAVLDPNPPRPHDITIVVNPGDIVTEEEHKDSCDINKMIAGVLRGQAVRGVEYEPRYGYDDTNMSMLDVKIMKQRLEKELSDLGQSEDLTEEDMQMIIKNQPELAKKFGFKVRKKSEAKTTNEPAEESTKKPGTNDKPDLQDKKKEPEGS